MRNELMVTKMDKIKILNCEKEWVKEKGNSEPEEKKVREERVKKVWRGKEAERTRFRKMMRWGLGLCVPDSFLYQTIHSIRCLLTPRLGLKKSQFLSGNPQSFNSLNSNVSLCQINYHFSKLLLHYYSHNFLSNLQILHVFFFLYLYKCLKNILLKLFFSIYIMIITPRIISKIWVLNQNNKIWNHL